MEIIILHTGSKLGPILSFVGSLIIAGVSVGIFVCDGRRTKQEKREQEEKELKDLYDYFQKLIHGIIDTLKKQKEEIDTRASEIENNPFNFHQLTFFVNKDFDRLSERMDLEKLYKAYLLVNKDNRSNNDEQIKENFQGIITSVDLTRGIINQVKDAHIEHSNYLENKLRSFKELVEDEITKEAGLLARRVRNSESENEEAKNLRKKSITQ